MSASKGNVTRGPGGPQGEDRQEAYRLPAKCLNLWSIRLADGPNSRDAIGLEASDRLRPNHRRLRVRFRAGELDRSRPLTRFGLKIRREIGGRAAHHIEAFPRK